MAARNPEMGAGNRPRRGLTTPLEPPSFRPRLSLPCLPPTAVAEPSHAADAANAALPPGHGHAPGRPGRCNPSDVTDRPGPASRETGEAGGAVFSGVQRPEDCVVADTGEAGHVEDQAVSRGYVTGLGPHAGHKSSRSISEF
jgi:hypothetical protein